MLVPPLLGDERTRRARGIAAQLTGLSSRGRWQRARDLVQTEKYLTTILLNLEGRLAAEGMQREIDTTGLIRVQIRRAYDVLWACIILGMTTGDHMMQAFRNLNDATRQLINYVYNIVGIPAGEEEERSERAEESSDTTPEEEERSEYTEENSDSIPEEEEERSEYTGEYSDTSE
jgi:hypothetical protein